MINVVLYQPEIPQNTGAIARTCALLQAKIHLVRPFGFQIMDRRMKRASMDYLEDAVLVEHASWRAFEESLAADARVWVLSGWGKTIYSQVEYKENDYLVFGRESDGVPQEILEKYTALRIPMPGSEQQPRDDHRFHSLNLSVSVGIAAFEAMRQVTGNWAGQK
jgi:tRNA (cytidine/uridine-2'-O-)-methyltransferase